MSAESLNTRTLAVGGIPVTVYSHAAAPQSQTALPVTVVFALHGRYSRSDGKDIVAVIKECFKEAGARRENGVKPARQLWIVALDHRNHGQRIVDKERNHAWSATDPAKHNETHAVDMYAIQAGTARDVSFLIDFLPSYLFPAGENHVAEWGVVGISLGGHSTWILLREEPRITFGVPIIGCPVYTPLMAGRMRQTFGTDLTAPRYPESLRAYVETPREGPNPYLGKRILVLSGADDQLVPWTASKDHVEALDVGPNGVKRVLVVDGAAHEVTGSMLREVSAFVADALAIGIPSRM